jgi:hypothetical protein
MLPTTGPYTIHIDPFQAGTGSLSVSVTTRKFERHETVAPKSRGLLTSPLSPVIARPAGTGRPAARDQWGRIPNPQHRVPRELQSNGLRPIRNALPDGRWLLVGGENAGGFVALQGSRYRESHCLERLSPDTAGLAYRHGACGWNGPTPRGCQRGWTHPQRRSGSSDGRVRAVAVHGVCRALATPQRPA